MKSFETDDSFPTEWEMIYVEKENPTNLEIIKEVIKSDRLTEVNRFYAKDFSGADHIKDDSTLFYQFNGNSIPYIWQVGPKATDINGNIIPNVYLVRKIGFWIQ